MMLVELSPVAQGDLPIGAFRSHLKLGTGFGDDTLQDEVLETCLRAALSTIEAQIGQALFQRRFAWSVTAWTGASFLALPVSPVVTLESVQLEAADGAVTPIDPSGLRVIGARGAPRMVSATGAVLPFIPVHGQVNLIIEAGHGTGWGDMPADLAQAVMILAAAFYEDRTGGDPLPSAVSTILAAHRPRRIGRGEP